MFSISGNQTDEHHEILLEFCDAQPLLLHFPRQQRRGQVQLVLHLNLGNIRVGTLVEGHDDSHAAIGVTLRRDVAQIVDAVHLLLDHLHDRILHCLRGSTGI
ncbi:hypothetical protein D3C71_1666180 [compost metagenome]